jgi:hydroxyethylthiazole kinase-like uncharacterized protein yjeF
LKIVTAAEMRAIDRASSEQFGVPSLTLMENAGTAVAQFVLEQYPAAKRVGVVCGKGNNGGDGFVAVRRLHEAGRDVRVILLADPAELHGDAAEMFKKMPTVPAIVKSPEDLEYERSRAVFASEVLIDAILGTGFRPPVKGLYADAIAALNTQPNPVVAVDIPSGADADAMHAQAGVIARADGLVTFTAPRPAHVFGLDVKGPTVVVPIGSPEEAIVSDLGLKVITPYDVAPLIQSRRRESNKGNYGHVLVIGGSLGKAGAAAMAGMSALRTGAGLVTVATPRGTLATVAGYHPEVMTEALEETAEGTISRASLSDGRLDGLVRGKTVLAVGPGISRNPETAETVRRILADYRIPTVLDADGLNAFEGQVEKLVGEGRPLVITPHPGEMSRLTGKTIREIQSDRIGTARAFAREHQLVVVLKGHRTLVAEPDGTVWVNTTGNPGMATGGTGDILTGIVAGMVAQNPEHVVQAAISAVYVHGLAGDVGCESMGELGLIATDLIGALPEAFRRTREAGQHSQMRWTG